MILSRYLLAFVVLGLFYHHANGNDDVEDLANRTKKKIKSEAKRKMQRKLKHTERQLTEYQSRLEVLEHKFTSLEKRVAAAEAVVCPILTPPKFGSAGNCSDDSNLGSTCSYVCEEGYGMVGEPLVSCETSETSDKVGVWMPYTKPACEPILCPILSASYICDDATVECSSENFYQSECVFKCSDGYGIIGNSKLTCLSNGTSIHGYWDLSPPTHCQPINCPLIAAPEHGSMQCSDSDFVWGSNCTFQCAEGYELLGNTILSCISGNGSSAHGYWVNDSGQMHPAVTPVCVEYIPPPKTLSETSQAFTGSTSSRLFTTPAPPPAAIKDHTQKQHTDRKPQHKCSTQFGYFKNGYRYDLWPRTTSTWNEAKENCERNGGELAYHGLEDLETRMEIVQALTVNERPYPGLRDGAGLWLGLRYATEEESWTYMNGTVASSSDLHWKPGEPSFTQEKMYHYKDDTYKCAAWTSIEGYKYDLMTHNTFCIDSFYGLCQFKCDMDVL